MPSINMIAPRRAEKLRLEREMRRLVVVIMAELILAVGLGGWVCTKLLTTRSQVASLDAQLNSLRPVVKQIEGYESATKKLVPKLQLLNDAKDRTMTWYNVFDRLTQSLPQSTYLTRISTDKAQKPENGAKVKLTGVSISQAKIGETMIRLHAIPDFTAVDLNYTQQTSVDKASAVEFVIDAAMKSTAPPKGVKPSAGSQS